MNNVYRIGPTRSSAGFDRLSHVSKAAASIPVPKRKLASRTSGIGAYFLKAASALLRAWISFAAIAAIATGSITFCAVCFSPLALLAILIGWLLA